MLIEILETKGSDDSFPEVKSVGCHDHLSWVEADEKRHGANGGDMLSYPCVVSLDLGLTKVTSCPPVSIEWRVAIGH